MACVVSTSKSCSCATEHGEELENEHTSSTLRNLEPCVGVLRVLRPSQSGSVQKAEKSRPLRKNRKRISMLEEENKARARQHNSWKHEIKKKKVRENKKKRKNSSRKKQCAAKQVSKQIGKKCFPHRRLGPKIVRHAVVAWRGDHEEEKKGCRSNQQQGELG